MNILAMGDLHGRIPKLPNPVLASRIDLMLLAGDITPNFMENWDMRLWNARKVNAPAEAASQKDWFLNKFIPWTKKFDILVASSLSQATMIGLTPTISMVLSSFRSVQRP
jgi:hypothetical protein